MMEEKSGFYHPSNFWTLDDLILEGKTVLLRVDMNSPLDPKTGEILDASRIRAVLPTLRDLEGARVVLLSHQGRVGSEDFTSLASHGEILRSYLGEKARFVGDIMGPAAIEGIDDLSVGGVLLLDNVRFLAEETLKAPPEKLAETIFVRRLAKHFNLYVNDAFGAVHRNQASLVGFPHHVPSAVGRLMEKELKAIDRVLTETQGKRVFVLGGAKPEDRIGVISHVLETTKGQTLFLLGGVLANVFLLADGRRLPERDLRRLEGNRREVEVAKNLLSKHGETIFLPVDYAYEEEGRRDEASIGEVGMGRQILDLGCETIDKYREALKDSDLIVASGPLGMIENPLFVWATKEMLFDISRSRALKVTGGGHLTAVIQSEGLSEKFDHVSSGGGALLYILSGGVSESLRLLRKDSS